MPDPKDLEEAKSMAVYLASLRDSLVDLSGNLREFLFQINKDRDEKTKKEVNELIQRLGTRTSSK